LVDQVDGGGAGVADSFVGQPFHRVAVVAATFDDAGVAAVTAWVEVAFRAYRDGDLGALATLMVRGKKRPGRRVGRR